MKQVMTSALAAALMLGGLSMLTPAAVTADNRAAETRIQSKLTGGALNGVTPSGSARFRSRGTASNFSVEVEDVALADGTVLTVTLMRGTTAIPAGTLRLALRRGEIDVNTNDGDTVPQAQAGDVVVVSDGGAQALLSGALR